MTKLQLMLIWGLLTIMFAWLTQETQSLWAFIFGNVAFLILCFFTAKQFREWQNKRQGFRELFEVYLEQTPDALRYAYTTKTSPNPQDVRITLRMKASVELQFIALSFKGIGEVPLMEKIYDHQFDTEHLGIVYKPFLKTDAFPNGGWNLTFTQLPHRNTGQRIRIGIRYISPKIFKGHLEVFVSTEQGAKKRVVIPFEVQET